MYVCVLLIIYNKYILNSNSRREFYKQRFPSKCQVNLTCWKIFIFSFLDSTRDQLLCLTNTRSVLYHWWAISSVHILLKKKKKKEKVCYSCLYRTCGSTRVRMCTQRSENNFVKSVHLYMSSWDQTRLTFRLPGQVPFSTVSFTRPTAHIFSPRKPESTSVPGTRITSSYELPTVAAADRTLEEHQALFKDFYFNLCVCLHEFMCTCACRSPQRPEDNGSWNWVNSFKCLMWVLEPNLSPGQQQQVMLTNHWVISPALSSKHSL